MSEEPQIEPIEGIHPFLWKPAILHAMAGRYARRANIPLTDAMDSACATWETEWEGDPRPRTMQDALEAVDSDLEHWGEGEED